MTETDSPYGVPQLSREDLERMRPEDIHQAKNEGRLDALLGRPVRANTTV
ncbi:hypothetical protein [Streptomyces avermitilis]